MPLKTFWADAKVTGKKLYTKYIKPLLPKIPKREPFFFEAISKPKPFEFANAEPVKIPKPSFAMKTGLKPFERPPRLEIPREVEIPSIIKMGTNQDRIEKIRKYNDRFQKANMGSYKAIDFLNNFKRNVIATDSNLLVYETESFKQEYISVIKSFADILRIAKERGDDFLISAKMTSNNGKVWEVILDSRSLSGLDRNVILRFMLFKMIQNVQGLPEITSDQQMFDPNNETVQINQFIQFEEMKREGEGLLLNTNQKVGFFPYFHTREDIDLSEFQIYRKDQKKSMNLLPCALYCLKDVISEEKYIRIAECFHYPYVKRRKFIKIVLTIIGIKIRLWTISKGTLRPRYYASSGVEIPQVPKNEQKDYLDLCLVAGHLFRNKKIWDPAHRGGMDREVRFIVRDIINNKLLEEMDIDCMSYYFFFEEEKKYVFDKKNVKAACHSMECLREDDKLDKWKLDHSIKNPCKIDMDPETGAIISEEYIYPVKFDFEAHTVGEHRGYCVDMQYPLEGWEKDPENEDYWLKQCFIGEEKKVCVDFLDSLVCLDISERSLPGNRKPHLRYPKFMCYAHNMKYDIKFLFEKVKFFLNIIEKGNNIYGVAFRYYSEKHKRTIDLYFRDNYKLMPMKAKLLPQAFGIMGNGELVRKEYMPHEALNALYGIEGGITKDTTLDISEVKKYASPKKYELFLENCRKLGVLDNNKYPTKFKVYEYIRFYCDQDVTIMRKAFFKFRRMVLEELGIDIFHVYTISSLAHGYVVKQGCYTGCYNTSGIINRIIGFTCTGGIVGTKNNKPCRTNNPVCSLDFNSMYAAGISRSEGAPLGIPKYYEPPETCHKGPFNDWLLCRKKMNYYYAFIKIKEISSVYDINFFHYKCYTGKDAGRVKVENPTQEMIDEGFYVYVAKTELENWELRHQLKYDVEYALFYNEGFNKKIIEIVRNLYDKRLEYKYQGNGPMEQLYKLILNNIYGKTIMKMSESCYRYLSLESEPVPKDPETGIFESKRDSKYREFIKGLEFNKYKTKSVKGKIQVKRWKEFDKGPSEYDRFVNNYGSLIKLTERVSDRFVKVTLYNDFEEHKNFNSFGSILLAHSKVMMNEFKFRCHELGLVIYYQDTDAVHVNITAKEAKRLFPDMIGDKLGQLKVERESLDGGIYLAKKSYYEGESKDCHRMKGIQERSMKKAANELTRGNKRKIYDLIFEGAKVGFGMRTFNFKGIHSCRTEEIIRRVSLENIGIDYEVPIEMNR